MNAIPYVITVILNTNKREDTLQCLTSLGKSTHLRHRTILLDNASTDGSVEAVREKFPDINIVRLTVNLGYAGNNNVGIERAMEDRPDWILLLNEDTVLDPECIARLVAVGSRDSNIGIVGPMVYHFDTPEIIQSAGGRLGRYWDAVHIAGNEVDKGELIEPHEVDWISGCCIMIRRQVVDQIGMIDERFFYYWEETELCIRARRNGWRIFHVPQARIWHKGVQLDYQPAPSVTYYATRNRLLTLSKHHAPMIVRLAVLGHLVRTAASWTLRPRWKHMRRHRDALLCGMRDFALHRWGKMRS